MNKIKIIEKFQGQGFMRLMDEPWIKLLDLEDGLFSETTSTLEFVTEEGLK